MDELGAKAKISGNTESITDEYKCECNSADAETVINTPTSLETDVKPHQENTNTNFCISRFQEDYPLHWHVWHNDICQLNIELDKTGAPRLEVQDPRRRTPLLLAVTLGYLPVARALLRHGASTQASSSEGWTVVQEAVSCGDPELLSLVLQGRDSERHSSRAIGIPHLLQKLALAPDFYVEMKWEFTSWVPLVSRMCPSDTYRVYKRGANVRIDTTLLGFHEAQWQRGTRSYIFKGEGDGAVMLEVDHDKHMVYTEQMHGEGAESGAAAPADALVSHRLAAPNVCTEVDTDKICFERDKAGIWGWRTDKTEVINNHDCKVFSASNVEIVTRTRSEHQTLADKQRCSTAQRSPLHSFFSLADETQPVDPPPPPGAEEKQQNGEDQQGEGGSSRNSDLSNTCQGVSAGGNNPDGITAEEYFDAEFDLALRDIGRTREQSTKVQKFKAVLWLAEDYPLRLQEQVMPIVDLMAISSTHFAKLQHFIQMQLPSGFPVKIEIPLFHVLTARITFGNIFGLDTAVENVTSIAEGDRLACILDERVFCPPQHYQRIGGSEPNLGRSLALEEDDALLQFALHQSLLDSGGSGTAAVVTARQMDVWEALKQEAGSGETAGGEGDDAPGNGDKNTAALLYAAHSAEQTHLQRAIEESLLMAQIAACDAANQPTSPTDKFEHTSEPIPNLSSICNSSEPSNSISNIPKHSITTPSEATAGAAATMRIENGEDDEKRKEAEENRSPRNGESDLTMALALSTQQLAEDEHRRRRQEEEMLQQVLQLSISDK